MPGSVLRSGDTEIKITSSLPSRNTQTDKDTNSRNEKKYRRQTRGRRDLKGSTLVVVGR